MEKKNGQAESKMAAKTFFSVENFKNNSSSKHQYCCIF
jgi:hypothetical protein